MNALRFIYKEKTMSQVQASMYDKLTSFASSHALATREVEHAPEGRTDVVSTIRGNALSAAVKAMVVMVKRGKSERRYFLACIPGDRRINFDAIRRLGGGDEARFAPQDRAVAMTGCEMGSVPPLSMHPDLQLVVDPAVLEHGEIVFNAGRLDRSFFVEPKAWFAATKGRVENVAS